MASQMPVKLLGHNPDVLTCIANLSNDEVFTPPSLANRMLDTLADGWADANSGANIWGDSSVRFLDPFTKSGVFLREIVRRLTAGLEDELPDLHERVDHILGNQVFGIGLTNLTALLARRSLYCSKHANGKHSVANCFENEDGNIWFQRTEHNWDNGKCAFCGAREASLGRAEDLETHAYAFIHSNDIREQINGMFGGPMQFDVLVGNPPYQLNDGGGTGSSAIPIYQKFVEQAKQLDPRYLLMITPSRWFSGGRGLDSFRDEMLSDSRLREIHDFPNAGEVFPGVEIKGGVSYFLWKRDSADDCLVTSYAGGQPVSSMRRPLLEDGLTTFIRHNELIPILHKVRSLGEGTFDSLTSANDPFGFDVREENSYRRVKPQFDSKRGTDSLRVYMYGWRNDGPKYLVRSKLVKGSSLVDRYKLFIPKAWGAGNPARDWLSPFIGEPGDISTETYLVVGPFSSEDEASNALGYTQTRFFHALVSAVKITQNTMKGAYRFVPIQDFSRAWTDEDLCAKYGISDDEWEFIKRLVRPDGVGA